MESKNVVITGVLGQIGSYAADLYIEKGYNVIGIERRSANPYKENIQQLERNPLFRMEEADICDFSSVSGIAKKYTPYLWLNFAAQSHVATSFKQPIYTTEVDYIGVLNQLEAIRLFSPETRFWQASTSERYGNGTDKPQNEETPVSPASPYAVAKISAEMAIKCYAKSYGLYATYGIMFNSESPRRSKAFVTRKITDYVAQLITASDETGFSPGFLIKMGQPKLLLGNIEARRSWTHAKDTVIGIDLQMQLDKPDVFVFGREESHSIKDFLQLSFGHYGLNYEDFVGISSEFYRPNDVVYIQPDCTKARTII